MVGTSVYSPGPATRVRRKERAIEDASFIAQIIDESLVAHVAFCTSDGLPQCLPMAFARVDDVLYLHGAMASKLLQGVANTRCSVTFTLLDGLVFARSAFHHSMNYRSAVVVGLARLVEDDVEKSRALTAMVEHMARGRMSECIGMTNAEIRSTRVVAIDVQEAVAKQRKGPPVDDPEHVQLGHHFAGVLPLALRASAFERDVPKTSLPIPASLDTCARAKGNSPIHETQIDGVLYSTDPSRVDFEWVHTVLSTQAYWALGIGRQALETSWFHALVFGAYRDGRQIGCARVLTDSTRMAYLGDVFVDAEYRGRGYGQALVHFVVNHPVVADCERILLGTQDAQALYHKFGFVAPTSSYMVRVKKPDAALNQ